MNWPEPPDTSISDPAQAHEPQVLVLRLYIAGASRRSTHAVTVLLQLCEEHFAGRYQLEILDVYQHQDRACADAIFATPTLLLIAPALGRYFVGDLQQPERLFAALGISSVKQ